MSNQAKADDAKNFVYLATAVSALGGMLFGYDIGVISGAILFIKKAFSLSAGLEEIVVSAVLLGSLVGAVVGGVLADRLGRRQIVNRHRGGFRFGGRGCRTGTGHGLTDRSPGSLPAPPSESLRSSRRFTFPKLPRLRFVAGSFRSIRLPSPAASSSPISIDYAFAASQAWRWMFALAVIPAAAFGIGLLFIPDSPRWLVGPRTCGSGAGRAATEFAAPEKVEAELERDSSTAWRSKKGIGPNCSARSCARR